VSISTTLLMRSLYSEKWVNQTAIEPSPVSDTIHAMQTVTLDELHADPYRIDRSIDAGEPIEIFRDGEWTYENGGPAE
jgi:hypothetical protein